MYETSDFKKGLKLMVEGKPYAIVDFQHVKPGKGNQFTRTKLRNLLTNQNLEVTFKSGEKFEVPNVENKEMNYLYRDEAGYSFMNNESYEQITLNAEDLGDARLYLAEGMKVVILFYNDKAVACDVPRAVNLVVAKSDPGIKGDRVSGATKAAIMDTGLVVQVPLHINEGDVLRIDTDSGDYVERVNQK